MNSNPPATAPGRWLVNSRMAPLAEIAVLIVTVAVLFLVLTPLADGDPLKYQVLVWGINIVMLLMIWAGLRLRGQRASHLGLVPPFTGKMTAIKLILLSGVVFVTSLMAFVIGAVAIALVLGRPEQADMSGYSPFQGNFALLVPVMLGIYIVSSFGEEVIYRGFMITRLEEALPRRSWASYTSAFISAIVFGLIHFSWGPAGVVQTGCMGLVLALAYLAVGRNLWVNVLAHAYLDTMLILPIFLSTPA